MLIVWVNVVKVKEYMNMIFDKIDSESVYCEFLCIENCIEEMEICVNYLKLVEVGIEFMWKEFVDDVEVEIEKMWVFLL